MHKPCTPACNYPSNFEHVHQYTIREMVRMAVAEIKAEFAAPKQTAAN